MRVFSGVVKFRAAKEMTRLSCSAGSSMVGSDVLRSEVFSSISDESMERFLKRAMGWLSRVMDSR